MFEMERQRMPGKVGDGGSLSMDFGRSAQVYEKRKV